MVTNYILAKYTFATIAAAIVGLTTYHVVKSHYMVKKEAKEDGFLYDVDLDLDDDEYDDIFDDL